MSRRAHRYEPPPERLILGDDPAPKAHRVKAQAACASARGEWAWMALDVCVSRHGGNLPHGANKVNGAPGVVEFLRKTLPELLDGSVEVGLVLPVSTQMQILGVSIVSKGARNMTIMPLGEVFAPVFMLPATGFILVHNHPSQVVKPSSDDDALTRTVKQAANTLGFRFLDHIIIAAEAGYFSYAEAGRL